MTTSTLPEDPILTKCHRSGQRIERRRGRDGKNWGDIVTDGRMKTQSLFILPMERTCDIERCWSSFSRGWHRPGGGGQRVDSLDEAVIRNLAEELIKAFGRKQVESWFWKESGRYSSHSHLERVKCLVLSYNNTIDWLGVHRGSIRAKSICGWIQNKSHKNTRSFWFAGPQLSHSHKLWNIGQGRVHVYEMKLMNTYPNSSQW